MSHCNLYTGFLLAISSSILWSFSAILFTKSGQKIGALSVNVYRLLLSSLFLIIIALVLFCFKTHPVAIPKLSDCFWLSISALLGLVIGDNLYFKSLIIIGPRRTTQLLALLPIFSMISAWVFFGEIIGLIPLYGVMIIVCGLMIFVFSEKKKQISISSEPGQFSYKGYLIGIIAAICQGMGAAFTRKAFLSAPDLDPIFATTIRIGAAALITSIAIIISGKLPFMLRQFPLVRTTTGSLIGGTLCGSVLGMLCFIGALKSTPAGIVSALSSLSPLLVIPIVVIYYKSKIPIQAIIGTCVAIIGVIVLSLFR